MGKRLGASGKRKKAKGKSKKGEVGRGCGVEGKGRGVLRGRLGVRGARQWGKVRPIASCLEPLGWMRPPEQARKLDMRSRGRERGVEMIG